MLAAGRSPGQARELLSPADRHTERVLLDVRLAEGLAIAELTTAERARVPDLAARDLVAHAGDRLTLTLPGRLLADAVVRDLLD